MQWAQRSQAKALIIGARNDVVVPTVHAQRLFAQWPAEKSTHILDGVGHNDLENNPEYYRLINKFLGEQAG